MELYRDLLLRGLENQTVNVSFSGLEIDLNKIVELKCYQVLTEIKEVLENSDLDDPECFERIEKIVCIFEKNGLSCNYRHDF